MIKLNIKKLEIEIAYEAFKRVKDIPEGRDRIAGIAGTAVDLIIDMKEKTKLKINQNKIFREISRLQKEYDDKIFTRKRYLPLKHIGECRTEIRRSLVQWRMGLWRDNTREYISSWVLGLNSLVWTLAIASLNRENRKKLCLESKTYVNPYPDDIIETLDKTYDIMHSNEKELETYNKLLSMISGIYDAIEILIGKKPEVKVIKEVREVILTVREKPKPQPKSTKFICFNCDKEYDKPIAICENCGFEFRKNKRK